MSLPHRSVLRVHRAVALAMAAFWALQAVTGTLLVFRWELDDALLEGPYASAEPFALGRRLATIEMQGGRASEIWASSGAADRFDIYYTAADGSSRVVRVDGTGRVLRDARDGETFANGAFFNTLTRVHSTLLGGEAGTWLIAVSGALLLVNLVLGLRIAWPARGGWRRALLSGSAGTARARLFGWHRLTGFWTAALLLPMVAAGVLLCFDDQLKSMPGAAIETPLIEDPRAAPAIKAGEALTVALARHKGATLSALVLPTAESPWFRVRLQRPQDPKRNWGTTTVFVALDGSVQGDHAAGAAPYERVFVDGIYPFHTGQLGGVVGRGAVLVGGLALTTLVLLGLRLWWVRRAR